MTHVTSYHMESHHQDREESQANPVKKRGSLPTPATVSSPAPLAHRFESACGGQRLQDHKTGHLKSRLQPSGLRTPVARAPVQPHTSGAGSRASVLVALAPGETPRMPPPSGYAASSQGPDRWPRFLSQGPNLSRAVPERVGLPPPECTDCRGGCGHSTERSDASHKNNNLLGGVCSR